MDENPEQPPANNPNPTESAKKPARNYPKNRKSPSTAAPNPQNHAIMQMEAAIVPLMDQRMAANQRVRAIQAKANQIAMELESAQGELAQIEGEVNFRLQTIAQMKGVPFVPSTPTGGFPIQTQYQAPQRFADYPQQPPSPMYQPIQPYPSSPVPMPGVSSLPAQNRGLHPDANDPRLNLERDPELIANNDRDYQFPADVVARINEGRR